MPEPREGGILATVVRGLDGSVEIGVLGWDYGLTSLYKVRAFETELSLGKLL